MVNEMKALSSSYKGKKYLQITRSNDMNLEDVKTSRGKFIPFFNNLDIELVITDYRGVNFDAINAIDIYVLIKSFKDDFPQCKRLALVSGPAPQNLFQHFEKASAYYDIDLKVHPELEQAKAWLCNS